MKFIKVPVLLTFLFLLVLPAGARAEDQPASLPPTIQHYFNAPPVEVGAGTYRKFGFRIYNVSLWARDKHWDPARPYALALHYTRGLSKETLVDTVIDDIRDQNVADDDTIARWQALLKQDLPDVEEDDVLVGLCLPGQNARLFYNGRQIASINDQDLSKAFFNIWLGDQADEDMRAELLGK
jgi:Chalcone isomerase-like